MDVHVRRSRHRFRYVAWALALILVLGVGVSAVDARLTERDYTVTSAKVTKPLRFVLLTDVHSQQFGKDQSSLLAYVAAARPDAVLLGGDIYDDETPHRGAQILVSRLAERYPTFYVSGNHEWWSLDAPGIKADVTARGAKVLDGVCSAVEIRSQKVRICGVDDPEVGADEFSRQLSAVSTSSPDFTILLAHRPERIYEYAAATPDVVLSGHTHGGQVRIPFLLNGLFAPDQGLFPPMAGGDYTVSGTRLIVSRGIVTWPKPRIWNPPEVVVVEVNPV